MNTEHGGFGVFDAACNNSDLDMIRCLHELGVSPDIPGLGHLSPLTRMARDRNYAVVNVLLGLETKNENESCRAVDVNAWDTCDERDTNPLKLALGDIKMMTILLNNGAAADWFFNGGRTVLMDVVELDDVKSAKLLLEHGADKELTDEDGNTLWSLAFSPDMKNLLSKPCEVDRRDKGKKKGDKRKKRKKKGDKRKKQKRKKKQTNNADNSMSWRRRDDA